VVWVVAQVRPLISDEAADEHPGHCRNMATACYVCSKDLLMRSTLTRESSSSGASSVFMATYVMDYITLFLASAIICR
jgi:hypothetical protein